MRLDIWLADCKSCHRRRLFFLWSLAHALQRSIKIKYMKCHVVAFPLVLDSVYRFYFLPYCGWFIFKIFSIRRWIWKSQRKTETKIKIYKPGTVFPRKNYIEENFTFCFRLFIYLLFFCYQTCLSKSLASKDKEIRRGC